MVISAVHSFNLDTRDLMRRVPWVMDVVYGGC